jgi:type III restriction enzyme
VIYEWIAEDEAPAGIPPANIEGFRNRQDVINTIRVDSKVVHETDTGEAKNDEWRWMRFTLDTVGKVTWPTDQQGRQIYPEGFEELAKKLGRPLHPPGRDVRCIVSVGMLTEGWDCNTVTHIIGLRPFLSQLLCEQVVGRGLRRTSYEVGDDGKFGEEVAKIFGVPFEIVPLKATSKGTPQPPVRRNHVRAVLSKAAFEIRYPRVEGYTQAIRNRVTVDWGSVPPLRLEPGRIPSEVEMKASLPTNQGRPSLTGPGKLELVDLESFRASRRIQELVFDLARTLTREAIAGGHCDVPAQVLFPQLGAIVRRYIQTKVEVQSPADIKDLFLSPYYGWIEERIREAIRPDTSSGETPEIPRYEANRGPGSTSEVDFWSNRDVREVRKSHVNFVVADTKKWEQSAAYYLDRNYSVAAFVKNAGLGFAIPYFHNGQAHDYQPDFIVRLSSNDERYVIVETKGYDPIEEVKRAAAARWVNAVNADGRYGAWSYSVAKKVSDVDAIINAALAIEAR